MKKHRDPVKRLLAAAAIALLAFGCGDDEESPVGPSPTGPASYQAAPVASSYTSGHTASRRNGGRGGNRSGGATSQSSDGPIIADGAPAAVENLAGAQATGINNAVLTWNPPRIDGSDDTSVTVYVVTSTSTSIMLVYPRTGCTTAAGAQGLRQAGDALQWARPRPREPGN